MCVHISNVISERPWLYCNNFQQAENINIKSHIYWDEILFSLLKVRRCLGAVPHLHLAG
jgi:hypothetical protein